METAVGVNGLIRLNKWTPVTVVLENRGRSVNGILEVLITSGSEYRGDVFETTYTTDLSLPYGSKKRCAFTVLIRSVTHDVKLRFRSGNRILAEDTVTLKDKAIDRDFALVLDTRISPGFLASFPERVAPARIDAKRLPDTWYGYDGVRMLILNPALLKQLHQRQFEALERWLKSGGHLVISSGVNYGALKEDRMDRLLPMDIRGHSRVSDTNALEKFSGHPFNGTEPLLVLNVRIDQSQILSAAGDIPLIVRKGAGRGVILFLAFDVQSSRFNRWPGRKDFWDNILARKAAPESTRMLVSDQQIADALLATIRLKFPRFWWAALFLVVYATIFGVLLKKAGIRHEKRKPYALCLVICALVFSILGTWMVVRKNRINRINYNSFYLLSGNGRHLEGNGRYVFGVYSIQSARCRIGFSASPYPILHVLSDKSRVKTPNPYKLITTAGGQQIETDLLKWSHSFFRADMQKRLPIFARLTMENDKLYLTIENNAEKMIQNGLIYVQGQFFPIGNIAAKETKIMTLEPDPTPGENQTDTSVFERHFISVVPVKNPPYGQTVKQHLAKHVLTGIHQRYRPDKDAALFVGWMQTGIVKPVFNEPIDPDEGIVLIDWEVPIGVGNES